MCGKGKGDIPDEKEGGDGSTQCLRNQPPLRNQTTQGTCKHKGTRNVGGLAKNGFTSFVYPFIDLSESHGLYLRAIANDFGNID